MKATGKRFRYRLNCKGEKKEDEEEAARMSPPGIRTNFKALTSRTVPNGEFKIFLDQAEKQFMPGH